MSDARLTVKVRIQPQALADLPESQPAPAPLSRPRIFMALCVIAALLFGAYTLWQSTHGAASSLIEQRELANEGDEATAADSAETTPATSESVAQSEHEPATSTPAVAGETESTTTVATLPPSDAALASQHPSAQHDTLNDNSSSNSSPIDSKATPTPQQATPVTLQKTVQAPAEDTRPAVANSALPPAVAAPTKVTNAANSAKLPDGFSRIVLTAQMESLQPGEPLGPVIAFPNVKRLYLFTEVKGYAGQVLTHRWYYKNQLHTEATLTIEDSPWRTYSENWLLDDQLGDWHVEIVDQAQKLLYRYDFRYQ